MEIDLTLDIRHTPDVSIVRMIGSLTSETYAAFKDCTDGIDDLFRRYVVTNLNLVSDIDISGFCNLLTLAQELRDNKRALAIVINDQAARDSFSMMGFDLVCAHESSAVAAFHQLAVLHKVKHWPKAS